VQPFHTEAKTPDRPSSRQKV